MDKPIDWRGSSCWFIFKTAPFTPSFTSKFEPRSTYPANFLGRVCRSVETGNQSWRFRSSSAKAKGSKSSRTKSMKGVEEAAMSLDLSTNE